MPCGRARRAFTFVHCSAPQPQRTLKRRKGCTALLRCCARHDECRVVTCSDSAALPIESYFGTALRRIGKRMTLDNDSRAPKEPSEYNVSSSLLGPQYDRAKSVPLSRALKATIFQAKAH